MRFITVRRIFFSLVVLNSLIVLGLSNKRSPRQMPTADEYIIPLVVVDGKKYFVPTGSACGNGFISCYQSLDGVKVCRSGGAYTERVERALRALLKEGILVERGTKTDRAGHVLGKRVVIVYEKKKTHRQAAAICWWGGDGFACIDGDSLDHALSFEKIYER